MNIWGSVLVAHLQPHGPARVLCPWNSPERILEWVDIPFSKRSSWPRTQTRVSCIAGRYFFFYHLSHQGSPYLGLRATPENAAEAYGLFWIKVTRKTVSIRRGLWPLLLCPLKSGNESLMWKAIPVLGHRETSSSSEAGYSWPRSPY